MRAATRATHERLDSLVDLRAWDQATHRWWLQRMLGLHEPLERELGSWYAGQSGRTAPDVPSRRRAGAIASDLRSLGLTDEEVRDLPRSPLPPAPSTRGQALGHLYVLDGSALGGSVIARHAVAGGIPHDACTSLAHDPGRIASWRETKALLDDLTPAELAEAVLAASELFAVFEAWLLTPTPDGRIPPQ
nr:biliverdin-producing heme oxygenase [Kineosporia mesophila]